MPKILWLAINYNSGASLRDLLLSIANMPNSEDVETIVVDNGAPEAQPILDHLLRDCKVQARALVPSQNLGYLGGARAGLSEYLNIADYPDFVIVSNVDLTILDSFIESLATTEYPDRTGIIGPSILATKGFRDLNPQYRSRPNRSTFHRIKRICKNRWLLNAYILASVVKRKVLPRRQETSKKLQKVYSVHGSCMIFTRQFFEAGGNLDHEPFLFGEEITLAERCRLLGLDIVYDPHLHVLHREHETTGLIRSRKIWAYQAESAQYIADTYFS